MYLLAVLGVMPIDGVLLPVGQIDLLHPAQHQLQQRDIRKVEPRVSFVLHVCVSHQQAEDDAGRGRRQLCESRCVPSPLQTNVIHRLCRTCGDMDSFR